jgi:hypothetical protein
MILVGVVAGVVGVVGELGELSPEPPHPENRRTAIESPASLALAYTVGFWQRMSQNAGAKPPVFLSTHPPDANRLKRIKADIPEAMKYYKK